MRVDEGEKIEIENISLDVLYTPGHTNDSYSYSSKTESTITVTLKPNPPGYIPGTSDITQSLCQLIAVGVTYPCSAG